MRRGWIVMRVRLVMIGLLAILLVALEGCVPRSGTTGSAGSDFARESTSGLTVVRVIDNAEQAFAEPGGGRIAFVSGTEQGDEQVFVLPSWEGTPAVAPGESRGGPAWIGASRDGVFASDWKGIRFAKWNGSLQTTLTQFADGEIIPSPSGARYLVDFGRRPSNTARDSMPLLVDTAQGNRVREWSRSINFSGGAVWLSDAQFLYNADSDGLASDIYLASVDQADRVKVERTGLVGLCPAPSPDGMTWAYYDGSRMLVLYDVVSKREIVRWATSTESGLDSPPSPPAWADDAHVVAATWGDSGATLSVVDVSAALKNYRASR